MTAILAVPKFRLWNSEPELRYLKPERVPIFLLKFGIIISECNENFKFCFILHNLIALKRAGGFMVQSFLILKICINKKRNFGQLVS